MYQSDQGNAAAVVPLNQRLSVNTADLQLLTGLGRDAAIEVARAAGARVCVGRRVVWNVAKIEKYLNAISE